MSDTWEPRWHLSVGLVLTGRTTGEYCGRIGMAHGAETQEECWQMAIDWLRLCKPVDIFLLHTWEIDVRYF